MVAYAMAAVAKILTCQAHEGHNESSCSFHLESPENEEGQLSPEANNSDENNNETEDYFQANSDLPKLNQTYGSHLSCQTQCAQTLKSMISELPDNK